MWAQLFFTALVKIGLLKIMKKEMVYREETGDQIYPSLENLLLLQSLFAYKITKSVTRKTIQIVGDQGQVSTKC